MRLSVAPLFIVAMALSGPASAYASDVSVTHEECASEVRVIARDAPLSAVLNRLAAVLDFELHFSGTDTSVNIDATQRVEDLLARLGSNVAMLLERNPHCEAKQRIVTVWILPRGSPTVSPALVTELHNKEQAELAKANAKMTGKILGMHIMEESSRDGTR